MKRLKIILLVLISAAAGAVIIQNRGTVKTQVLFGSFELPLILLLGLSVLTGFILGLLVAALSKSKPSGSK